METLYVNNPSAPFGEHSAAVKLNGWAVVNAPRPLPGLLTWQGDFRHGIFYAAGPEATFGADWRDLDAWPVQEITNMQVTEILAAQAKEAGYTLTEILSDWGESMRDLAHAAGYPWFERQAA